MLYLIETLITFFLVFYTSDQTLPNLDKALVLLFVFFLGYFISKNNYFNLALALSFLVSGYRPISEILICIGCQLFGALAAFLLITAINEEKAKYDADTSFMGILVIEFLCSFMIVIAYYCLFVDIRNAKVNASAFGLAAIYAGLSLSFPGLPCGNFLNLLLGFRSDFEVVVSSIIGQIAGSISAALVYKMSICTNNSIKMKEIEVIGDEKEINF